MILRPPISTRTDTLFPTRRSSDLLKPVGALVERQPLDLGEDRDQPGNRIVGEVWVGDVPLLARHVDPDIDRAAPPDLDRVAEPRHRGGFADEAERSEERRVGKACVRTCKSRWSLYH